MADVSVNIEVEVDVEWYDFVRACNDSELNDIAEDLIQRGYIKPTNFIPEEYLDTLDNAEVELVHEWLMVRYNTKFGINHANIVKALTKIGAGILQLTTEEEEIIKSIANRLV